MIRSLALVLTSSLVLGVALPALAVDGVVEINQVCATQTGCVPTDTAGFPVSLPLGSYRLTSNLDVSVGAVPEDTHGVFLADGATLDLNGFAILGTTVCSGAPPAEELTCTPTGVGVGVGGGDRVTVKNGTIAGTGNRAVACGQGCLIDGMRIENSGSGGISVADGSIVRNSTSRRNRFAGISFTRTGGLVIQGNTVMENGDAGIFAGPGDVVEGNLSRKNSGIGIFANSGAVVRGNTCRENGSHGISTGGQSRVTGNSTTLNLGFGIQGGAYDHNTVEGNILGTVNGGTDAGGNVCGGTVGCP